MEQYLTTAELSKKIKMAPATIRNLVWKKVFQQDVHYLKPTGGKLLFIWSAIEAWLYGGSPSGSGGFSEQSGQNKGLINTM